MINNNSKRKCQVVHYGFDRLEVSYQAKISSGLLATLAKSKDYVQSQEHLDTVATTHQGEKFNVMGYGASKGRYRYVIDTGYNTPLGYIVYIRNSTKLDWNLRIIVKSQQIVKLGYEGVKKDIERLFKTLGCQLFGHSIGRIDFCVDIADKNFSINPDFIVTPAQSSRSLHCKKLADLNFTQKGREFNSITVGQMPNAQLQIYNKTLEVSQKGKKYWWDIWGLKEEKKQKVWRVEVRFGKDYLKKIWDVRTYQDFEDKAGDMFAAILGRIRVLDDSSGSNDSNITRAEIHPIWEAVKEKVLLCFKVNGCVKGRIIQACKEDLTKKYRDIIKGMAVSYANLRGYSKNNIDGAAWELSAMMRNFIANDNEKVNELFDKAEDRFHILKMEVQYA